MWINSCENGIRLSAIIQPRSSKNEVTGIYNNALKKADKVTFKELKDGKKIRIFKSTKEAIDV